MATRDLTRLLDRLDRDLEGFEPADPVRQVYNPLRYARGAIDRYVELYAFPARPARDRALLVGMNPGPFGMAQTGVPFGAVSRVRDFLRIEVDVGRPPEEHPKRPVEGFACQREEVSGDRLWGWAEERWRTPARFFRQFFVWNYCPLLFLAETGRNVTPDKLPAENRRTFEEPCNRALREVVGILGVTTVIGIGVWAEKQATTALEGLDVRIERILHPSPASPIANRGWAAQATAQLEELGFRLPDPT